MPALPALRQSVINLRASEADKALIDQAAGVAGLSRSSFMLEASVQRAQAVLADQVRFALPSRQLQAFQQALDAPMPEASARALARLLGHAPPWRE